MSKRLIQKDEPVRFMDNGKGYFKFTFILLVVGGLVFVCTITPSLVWFSDVPLFKNYSVGFIRLQRPRKVKLKPKIILDYTSFFGDRMEKLGWLNDCPESNCMVSSNQRQLLNAHALIIHIRDFSWRNVPSKRYPWQRYVFFVHESPRHIGLGNLDKIPGFFNWTLTYRSDSDFPLPYGGIAYKNDSKPYLKLLTNTSLASNSSKLRDLVRNKSSPVVWFVSNCATPSGREIYVHALQKYIQVDIFGNCGSPNCSRSVEYKCRMMTERKYFFYIAFENSLCRDYITEKLWGRLNLWTVPIVLDRGTYQGYLPDQAFIAVSDFTSAAEMAKRLRYLMQHRDEYVKYFDWKLQGTIYHFDFYASRGSYLCEVCRRLWNHTAPKKSIYNLNQWWHSYAYCRGRSFVKAHLEPFRLSSTKRLP